MSNSSDRSFAEGARQVYAELKLFFATPLFFILLGSTFLIAAFRLMEDTHPSFVFLLAILGISIVLYGTGSQGVGSAEFKDAIPVKVAVAGGAGVLAAVFGFGILWQSERVSQVFKTSRQYGLVVLKNETNDIFDLTTLRISARSLDGRQLHLLSKPDAVEIVTPITFFSDKLRVCVELKSSSGKPMTGPNPCPPLMWMADKEHEYGEQISRVARGTLPLVSPQIVRVDENNRTVEQTTFSAQ